MRSTAIVIGAGSRTVEQREAPAHVLGAFAPLSPTATMAMPTIKIVSSTPRTLRMLRDTAREGSEVRDLRDLWRCAARIEDDVPER